MISFAHPWFLLLIPAVMFGAWLMARRKRPTVKTACVIPFCRIGKKRKWHLTAAETALVICGLLLAVAIARPRKPEGSRTIRAQGVDIILALDMSGSMECFDKPQDMSENEFVRKISENRELNRIESAKEEIRKFIQSRPNDRIGLIGFADLAYSFVPPTLDHALLLNRLKSLKTGELGNATGITSPIGTGVRHLQNSPSPRRVLVLFTDGANTAENRISPQDAAKLTKEFNVILHTVGIGGNNSYIIDNFGRLNRVQSQPDTALLQELAKISGGNCYTANDADGMKEVMQQINRLERTSHHAPQPAAYTEYAPMLALAATAVLLLGIIISSSGKLRLP
ncbi:MAG: VWA domain-containing protein [Lentisphaeria bacterium]|nr:VWA domain-containing protein [Lentisphaeria bacterium]